MFSTGALIYLIAKHFLGLSNRWSRSPFPWNILVAHYASMHASACGARMSTWADSSTVAAPGDAPTTATPQRRPTLANEAGGFAPALRIPPLRRTDASFRVGGAP